jgi:hypothetical protein
MKDDPGPENEDCDERNKVSRHEMDDEIGKIVPHNSCLEVFLPNPFLSKGRQVRNLEAADFKNPKRTFYSSIVFDPKDAVPRLFFTDMSRNTNTTQMSEAFLRIIGKLMAFTTENRDPLHLLHLLHCPSLRETQQCAGLRFRERRLSPYDGGP